MNILAKTGTTDLSVPLDVRSVSAAIYEAARELLPHMEAGRKIDSKLLRSVMCAAFAGSDASGAWTWKQVYEACEAATVLFLTKHAGGFRTRSVANQLRMLERLASLLPTHTRRSEESEALQQFSTPIELGFAAAVAASITAQDLVLEPSAGNGLLAIHAQTLGARLHLNELSSTRRGLVERLFPAVSVTDCDAAQINDHLGLEVQPSVVLMNPPFSALAHVDRRMRDAGLRHVSSALSRLVDGGRLVAITGGSFSPANALWRDAFVTLQGKARMVFSVAIDGRVYARHGTTTETRLTVFDKVPADDPTRFDVMLGRAETVGQLLEWIGDLVPPRQVISYPPGCESGGASVRGQTRPTPAAMVSRPLSVDPVGVELSYDVIDWQPNEVGDLSESIYEPYALQSIRIPGANIHPTRLVQSAAMAPVAPPKPSYRPHLPVGLVEAALLSDAQLESVIYAGEAHAGLLAGSWTVGETFDQISAVPDDTKEAVRFRRGWFLGDGTGAGKGRQVAGVLLDNWLKGRRRAVWVSKSDKLLEDAQRDWSALGMERLLVTPLSRFVQGAPIRLPEGILFTTYATLRSDDRNGKASRVRQIVDWLGRDFDGVIVFDESHALQNAAGSTGERGDQEASQQGRAGLRLQHALPNARVLYVSATGATTVHNLAYAQRLGLWGGEDFPFANRAEFVEAVEGGGVAAMEVLARDLKALGLYASRSLSYEGVEYELLEHQLTDAQRATYDAYAGAFQIIHNNLTAAMEAANITGAAGALNRQAKAAARSAFESAKQRFFNHLITAMKTPSLIGAIEHDLEQGHAPVIQIVSTGEALMERRLAEIPAEEFGDVRVDITPREYVLDYLQHSFPVQLYEPYSDADGNLSSRPVYRDGQPVECREAVARRDGLIEKLASLDPVPGALDQIVQKFGAELVAEVTGRSRRIVRRCGTGAVGVDRLVVESRPGSANLAEAQAFMNDEKRILVFSDAGGTGRSYHAELSARNQRLRVHYLLEAGWKADTAIQGLGRTNRTNQAQTPLFRPVATDVKAEKRFLSTIARRLDTLGAITRGQRQTGGQGLFRAEDNLESSYARDALRRLYNLIFSGKIHGCSLAQFEEATGLVLTDDTGLREDLPPITTFLNRLLALTIGLQNILFEAFEQLLAERVEGAIAAGTFDAGLETLSAESFVVTDSRPIYTHPSGAATSLLTIRQRQRNEPMRLDQAVSRAGNVENLLINDRSGRAAIRESASSVMLDDGEIERRVRLVRPMDYLNIAIKMLQESNWRVAERVEFEEAWNREVASVPEFSDSTIHIVTGLLLPIWRRLPNDATRILRLQLETGQRIIGRKVSPAWVAATSVEAGIEVPAADLMASIMATGAVVDLSEGLQLRRVRVMGVNRLELANFTDAMRERLRAYGCFAEIISWKLRFFVPVDEKGPQVLERILKTYALQNIRAREAA